MADRTEQPLSGKIYVRVFYDGTHYRGWAKQKDAPSIQATLEEALKQTGASISGVRAFSRTDAGVSALSQIVRVSGQSVRLGAANRVLPEDVAITHYAKAVGAVKWKTYVYVKRDRWRNPSLVAQAIRRLQQGGLIRRLYKTGGAPPTQDWTIELLPAHTHEYVFFKAKGFGYQQVRMVMGYLEAVDREASIRVSPAKARPAEAEGLVLLRVETEADWVELADGLLKAKKYLWSKISGLEWLLSLYRFMSACLT